MKPTRFFLDTAFVQALLNKNDQYHRIAKSRLSELRTAQEVWTTEAILIEIGNALSTAHRAAAARFITQCYATPNLHVVPNPRASSPEGQSPASSNRAAASASNGFDRIEGRPEDLRMTWPIDLLGAELFECMGMGIPVLHGVAGESAEIVEREGVGLVFEPENVDALCAGLLRLAPTA